MSGTVAHAILYKMRDAPEWMRPSMECTAKFIGIVDKMLDCMNDGNYTEGKCTGKYFKQPYRGPVKQPYRGPVKQPYRGPRYISRYIAQTH